jgi:hypothetical protein
MSASMFHGEFRRTCLGCQRNARIVAVLSASEGVKRPMLCAGKRFLLRLHAVGRRFKLGKL